jgi:hypothetical protein
MIDDVAELHRALAALDPQSANLSMRLKQLFKHYRVDTAGLVDLLVRGAESWTSETSHPQFNLDEPDPATTGAADTEAPNGWLPSRSWAAEAWLSQVGPNPEPAIASAAAMALPDGWRPSRPISETDRRPGFYRHIEDLGTASVRQCRPSRHHAQPCWTASVNGRFVPSPDRPAFYLTMEAAMDAAVAAALWMGGE